MGHIAITGIVNASGWMEHLALQTTRLSTVIAMANMITRGILYTLSNIYGFSEEYTTPRLHTLKNTLLEQV